jgi:branched-chain amino acid transport system ATP-binding protein
VNLPNDTLMNFDVFISYSTKDAPTANAACAVLESAKIRCWIAPRDILPGAPWGASIVRAIDQCRVMVLIFSASANGSRQVHREVNRAFSKGVAVVPLRIENITPADELAYYLDTVHWLDALTPPLERSLAQLTTTVRTLLTAPQPTPASSEPILDEADAARAEDDARAEDEERVRQAEMERRAIEEARRRDQADAQRRNVEAEAQRLGEVRRGEAEAKQRAEEEERRKQTEAEATRLRECEEAERHAREPAATEQQAKIMPLLEVVGLSKRFGGFVALDGINLSVSDGERVGLIGPNGSGKSTLVNCICGTLTNEGGSVRFNGETMDRLLTHERTRRGIARSFQLPRPFATLSVAQNVRVPLLYTVNARPGTSLSEAEIAHRCAELLALVGLAEKGPHLPRDLTQVEMRKLELARAMAAEPRLLIADEAMAGLSQSEVDDIVSLLIRLNERGITIILIEHIMRAVMRFSQRLVVLVSGKKIADGGPDVVIRDPEVEKAYLGE